MGWRILIVEDNLANRVLLRDLLEYHQYTVLMAANGEEGIRMAASEQPDLILMDIQMPVMNGYAALDALKRNPRTQAIPIVAVTSFAMPGDEARLKQAGADGYISKPIDTRKVPKLIHDILERTRTHEESPNTVRR